MYHEEARRILPASRVSGYLTDRLWANPLRAKVARGILSKFLRAPGIRSARLRPPRAQLHQGSDRSRGGEEPERIDYQRSAGDHWGAVQRRAANTPDTR